MFGLFRKKQTPPPEELIFKSNEAAFEMACKYMNTELNSGSPVIAVVLGQSKRDYCVKLANPEDSTIPSESPEQLLESKRMANICFSASVADNVPSLKKGDLVMYTPVPGLAAFGKGHMAGVIVAKIKPQFNTTHGGWLIDRG